MVTVEFVDWRGKVDCLRGEVTRESTNGFYILEKGEEYYVANAWVLGIWEEESNNGQS